VRERREERGEGKRAEGEERGSKGGYMYEGRNLPPCPKTLS
jgi:hypothetical protein